MALDDLGPTVGHGGKRPGAGRKKITDVGRTQVAGLDLRVALDQPPPDSIETVASAHARLALDALAWQLLHGASEPAKISAALAILDRGYGKPSVDIGGEAMLPFMTAPSTASVSAEIRAEARRHAHLAIMVLQKIVANGASETARVASARALLDRGLGTVGAARLPDDLDRPVGKRAESAQDAQAAATGRYATPPPPSGAQ